MKHRPTTSTIAATAFALALLGACGGSDDDAVAPVTITVVGPNVVSQWNEIATTTINLPAAATGQKQHRPPAIHLRALQKNPGLPRVTASPPPADAMGLH